MSITVSAVKARQNLGELLNLVSIKHEDVIIERAGKKIARLTTIEEENIVREPVAEYKVRGVRPSSTLKDIAEESVPEHPDILDLFGLGKEMWKSTGLTPDEYVRKEREEWD